MVVKKDTQSLARPSMAGNQNAVREGFYTRDKEALKLRARAVRRLVEKAYRICPWLTPMERRISRSLATTLTPEEIIKARSPTWKIRATYESAGGRR